MFVYAIRCGLPDLVGLPPTTVADYYMDYGLLVFPAYSRPTFLQSYSSQMNPYFYKNMKRLIEEPNTVHEADLEHPYISDDEDTVVKLLQESTPGILPAWYHVPKIA